MKQKLIERLAEEYVRENEDGDPTVDAATEVSYAAGIRDGLALAAAVADKHYNGFHSPYEYSADIAEEIRAIAEKEVTD